MKVKLNKEYIKQPEKVFEYKYLSRYFEYDPEDGRVYHKEIGEESLPAFSRFGLNYWNNKAGKVADSSSHRAGNTKYRIVSHVGVLGKTQFSAHRLSWLLYYGGWPKGHIDHLDGNALNNRIENLRDCKDTSNNMRNTLVNKRRKYPRGVRFTLSGDAKTPTFRAWYRGDDGKDVQLYCGRDYFEACCARKSWENEILKNPENGYTPRHFGRE